jgi:hypothetical protein
MGWMIGVRFSAGARNFSLHHRVQNSSGAHSASYPMRTRGSFTGGKAAGAWRWPITSIECRAQECVELYLHPLSTSLWRRTFLQLYLYFHSSRCNVQLPVFINEVLTTELCVGTFHSGVEDGIFCSEWPNRRGFFSTSFHNAPLVKSA